MPLSDEEKRGLLEDARDPRRREVMRRFRRSGETLSPEDYLRFLESASDLFAADRPPLRRARRFDPGGFVL